MSDDSGLGSSPVEEMACVEVVELVTDYLEDALSVEQRRRFVAHLADCGGCEAYLAQVRAVIVVASSSPREGLSPEAREQALATFRAWVDRSSGRDGPG